jgi:NodT family efflux transporter outer membrane factor (OMF) lipoprotein
MVPGGASSVSTKDAAGPAGAQPAAVADRAPSASSPEKWWQSLGDPVLDAVVHQALEGSLRLEAALARLEQARALEVATTGVALPQVSAASGGGHGTGSNLARGGRTPGALHAADQTSSQVSHLTQVSGFNATWDLDLSGRFRRLIEAAHDDAQAAAAARDAVQLALVGDLVRTYFVLRGAQLQARVLDQNVAAAERLVEIVQARFERGITNELDLTLARRQLASARADLAPVRAREQAASGLLATLSGVPRERLPEGVNAVAPIPVVPARVELGLPLDLLRRRPDLRQAEWELAGATARIGVATGNLFPSISLGAALGRQRAQLVDGGDARERIWSLGYGASLPLLDFGTLDALVRVADLQARERLALYRQAVIDAVREVDDAGNSLAAQRERARNLGEAAQAAQRATDLATERYERGLTDFLNVVDAQRQQYALEAQWATALADSGSAYATLWRSLGGGWQMPRPLPPAPLPEPDIVAMFHRLVDPAPELRRAQATAMAPASAPDAAWRESVRPAIAP